MDIRTLKKLELDKIMEMLTSYCASSIGADTVRDLEPMTHALTVNQALDETCEAVSFLNISPRTPIRMFDNVKSTTERAHLGGTLRPGALLSVATFLGVSRDVKTALDRHEGEIPILKGLADLLVMDRYVENEIKRCILSEDEISDSASTQLSHIRKEIKSKQSQIRNRMDSMLKGNTAQYLQDAIITIRNGRFVLPVKSEHKGNVQGLVHDVSSSGSTVFVEPMAVVEMNNAIKTLLSQEQAEIEAILKSLSQLVGENTDAIRLSYDTLGRLDFIFAKAQMALEMDAVRPLIQDDFYIKIIKGRHPLIDKDTIVPIDVWIGRDFRCLIITGPNTGGKTVSLKTTGLFALMTQCGLLIPAASGTCMPIFQNIYADIGDEQSIEQSLSTFSSHMKNIVSILDEADYQSLVLLDELGAGTDPTEGAALGISILENLLALGCLTMATTHYSELKAFAMTTDAVENAAMEFNIETLSPTYKMGIGIPGKSNAFEISRRLGLDESIIKRSREHISGEGVQFEDVIQSAERNRKASIRLRKEAEIIKRDADTLLKRAQEQQARLNEKKDKELNAAKIKAREILDKASEEADAVIRHLKDLQKNNTSNLDRERTLMKDLLRDAAKDHDTPSQRPVPVNVPKKLSKGETVRLIDSDTIATVITPPNAKGQVQVQAGIMKLTTQVHNLEKVAPVKPASKPKRSGVKMRTQSAPLELDIRGHSSEEGIMALDLYLDNAFTSSVHQVQVIHGKGSGVLRAAVHRHLRSHPHVKSYRLGKYGEGEDGVTIVDLK